VTKVIVGTRGTSGCPEFAGSTWVRLQYVLGLQKLGLETSWVDHLPTIDPLSEPHSLRYLVCSFARTLEEFGFMGRYCIVYNGGEQYIGMTRQELDHLAESADLLISVSGHLLPDSPLMRVPRRVYVDVDPGFTQIWAHQAAMCLETHNVHVTTGQNVGDPGFAIPTLGIQWHPIVPPVVLQHWPAVVDERCRRFSTIADWRGSQEALFEGTYYGSKRHEFMRFLNLPGVTGQPIQIALTIGPGDHEDLGLLHTYGWKIKNPVWHAGDPWSYREFIQSSRAEFSVAKSGYVRAQSGWVSDRTACYLASGKPAVVQSTGFEQKLPVGRGLLTFRSFDEAVAAIEAVNRDYLEHCRAARSIAEEYFDSDIVLRSLMREAGL
jgi:hypothetical protein